MAKDPAFLFYPNDWIGGTLGMSFEEKGAYMELLMLQFNRGHMTSHMIGHAVGQIWVKIKDKFEVDSDGNFYNVRLELEQEKRRKYSKSRRNNVSGKNQYSNDLRKTGHMSSHMEIENINSIIRVFNCEFSEKEIINYYAMIVKEMMDIFLKYRPTYEVLIEEDYHSLLEIAYTIAERKGWDKKEILVIKKSCLLESWEKVVEWLTGEKQVEYYKTMPLDKICTKKGFRDIQERMKTTPILSEIKLKQMESKRITHEQYFEE